MQVKIEEIRTVIANIPFVKNVFVIEQKEFDIMGKVEIFFDGLETPLFFDFKIAKQYPFKTYNSESIIFSNKDLIDFSHVMADGHICIHSASCPDTLKKISIDFYSLREWIIKYYINQHKDINYEHIIVNEQSVNGISFAYCFTDNDGKFVKGEFGKTQLSFLSSGLYKDNKIQNFLVQGFESSTGEEKKCQWSDIYKIVPLTKNGLYYFIGEVPATHGKFIFRNWIEFKSLLSINFLNLLYTFEKNNIQKHNGEIFPIFLGYYINEDEIHWQVALLEIGKFPLNGIPERSNGIKTGVWNSQLIEQEINWGLTRNSSYKYFFGRGTFCSEITTQKILIIGVGAIGSMIATTLTRCGCKYIDFIDFDIKEPENVCRSEYTFWSGIINKTEELKKTLFAISPFVNSNQLDNNYFEMIVKSFRDDTIYREKFSNELNNYDIIFDCSTDNDLMYILDHLDLKSELINISITNHADDLVCAYYPNIYRFVNNQFTNVLNNDVTDLYNPTGCWSPTFKASYNDINSLVQLALNKINVQFQRKNKKENFVIKQENSTGHLKILEY